MAEISSFPSNPDMATYAPHGRSYGNPLLDLLAFSATGFNYAPRPEGQQSIYDSYIQRERSRQFMNIQGSAFSNNMLFKMAGVGGNSALNFLGKNAASPDGAVARMLSPLVGGNPMAAQMQLYAGLQGANLMGNFGRTDSVTVEETNKMMNNYEGTFYKKKSMDQVSAEMDANFQNTLINNPAFAQQLGIGLPLDKQVRNDFEAAGKQKEQYLKDFASDNNALKAVGNTSPILTNISKDLMTRLESHGEQVAKDIRSMSEDYNSNEIKKGTKDYNAELAKTLNEQLKKKLKSTLKLTEDELKGAVADNKYDPQEVRRLTQKMQATMKNNFGMSDSQINAGMNPDGTFKQGFIASVMGTEGKTAEALKLGLDPEKLKGIKLSDEAERIHSLGNNRKAKLGILESLSDTLEETSGVDTDAAREKRKKAVTRQREELLALGVSKDVIDKNTGKGGMINKDFMEKQIAQLSKSTYIESQADSFLRAKKAGGQYGGIDFEKTRGFNLEDFSSAFVAASDLRLTGGKGSAVDKQKGFLENSGGALDAARSVFGDKLSGGQLVGKISDLLGSKAGDLSTKQGSSEIESMLRDMKATARVAGISIDAMVQTIDAAKDLARNNPRLRFMSASATTDMSVKAFSTVAGMAGTMSNTDYRRSGGTQQMVADRIGEEQRLLSSDMGQSLAALQQKYSGDPNKKAALDRVLSMDKYKNGITGQNLPSLLNDIVAQKEMAGESISGITSAMGSTGMRELAMRNSEITNRTTEMMKKTAGKTFFGRISNTLNLSEGDIANKYAAYRKQNPNGSIDDFMSTTIGNDAGALNFYNENRNILQDSILRAVDPKYFEKIEAQRKESKQLDETLARKLGGRNASAITQLMSAVGEGHILNPDKTKQILNVFSDDRYSNPLQRQRLSQGFEQALNGAAYQDASGVAKGLSEALGTEFSEEEIQNVAEYGKTEKDVDSAKEDYQRLQKRTDLNEGEQKRLRAYQTMDKMGALNSTQAYDALRNGKGVAGVTASAMEAERQRKNNELIEGTRQEQAKMLDSEMTDRLSAGSSASEGERDAWSKVRDYYHGDTVQMMKDASSGAGAFDKEGAGKSLGIDWENGAGAQVKSRITEKNNAVDEIAKQSSGGSGEESPEAALSKQLKELVAALDKSELTNAVKGLAGAVRGE